MRWALSKSTEYGCQSAKKEQVISALLFLHCLRWYGLSSGFCTLLSERFLLVARG
jgi:hypothetical protein